MILLLLIFLAALLAFVASVVPLPEVRRAVATVQPSPALREFPTGFT